MELNERDIDWQNDAPTLAAMGKSIPFTLPAGYFEELSENLQGRILIETFRTEHNEGFKLPEGYFEELSARIESAVTVGKIRAGAPNAGFVLPIDYFSGLTEKINVRLEESSAKRTVVRRLFTSWVSYAAAACITVIMATGVYFSYNTHNFSEQLSEVPDDEIMNYLQAHSTAGDTPFIIETLNPDELETVTPDVSAEELELYINNTTL